MNNYLESLNPQQKKAVLQTEGPVLIVAGAGAGKTKTLTYRIFHLVKQGVAPESILAITFTNKAAKEMQDRVQALLSADPNLNLPISHFPSPQSASNYNSASSTGRPSTANYPWIGTFHSLGVKILRANYRNANISASFSIFDRGDSVRLTKEAMKIVGIDQKSFEPAKILAVISREKGNSVSAEEFTEIADKNYFRKMVISIWLEYEKLLKREKALDFDDLLLKTVQLLGKNPEIREHYQKKWPYIHIDEYQDTNVVQYKMIKLLSGETKNVCVVGDGDQLIYGWRGADIKNILSFEKDYPETKIFILEENYRSTQTILTVANRIIAKNKMRHDKNLFTKNPTGERIGLYTSYDETDEANFVSQKCAELIEAGLKPSSIAVLYRANFQSRALEEAFLGKGLPYQVLGTRFFERKEVKDAVAYLRASLAPESFADWQRIVNAPPRGIGKVTLAKIVSGQSEKIPPAAKKSLDELKKLLAEIAEKVAREKISVVLNFILSASGLIESLKKDGTEGEERIENLRELITFATRYDEKIGRETAENFLTDVALASDQDELKEKKEAVRLMTVHASKGLEFDVVFVTGLEEDLFPHKKLREEHVSDSEAEEERRLFYVALTRARKKVYLSYAGIRTIFGARQVNIPSEFILDIDEEFIANEEPVAGEGKVIYLD